jgi:hypothetical protein
VITEKDALKYLAITTGKTGSFDEMVDRMLEERGVVDQSLEFYRGMAEGAYIASELALRRGDKEFLQVFLSVLLRKACERWIREV